MICSFFFEDHRRIDAMFSRLRRDLSESRGSPEPDAGRLAESFHVLDERLERHIRWEEEVLFPAVEGKAPGLARGPGRVMRLEHTEIRSYMRKLRECFAAPVHDDGVRQCVRDTFMAVESLLCEHNEAEETMYYPLCDHLFSSEEAALVLDRIHEQP